MTKRIERPPSSTWPSDQVVPEIIGDSDEVIAVSDDPAYVLLSRLFGPSIPRTILVQDVDIDVSLLGMEIDIEVSPQIVDIDVEVC